jgi:actin-related protein
LGTEAYKKCSTLNLRYPIEYGCVVDWDEFEELYQYILFNALEIEEDVSGTSLIFTEPVFTPKANRNKLAELVFENFGFHQMMSIPQAFSTMVAEGNTTGLVIDLGESSTSVVPIFDSKILNTSISRLDIGGRTLNSFLIRMLKNKLAFLTSYEKEIARFIKEETCFIQPNRDFFKNK